MASVAGSRSAPAAAQHPYSCNTCQVAFRNSDLQKVHMKSDWHSYNLKRRVALLPPISSELFVERVLQTRATAAAKTSRASFERSCDVCQKTYSSENSFRNHISSQKHRAREAAEAGRGNAGGRIGAKAADEASSVVSSAFSLGDPSRGAAATATDSASQKMLDSDAEDEFFQVVAGIKNAKLEDGPSPVKRPSNPRLSVAAAKDAADAAAADAANEDADAAATDAADEDADMPDEAAVPKSTVPAHSLKLCLFCNYESPSVALSVSHMERFHGMFIPEKQFLVDLEGLLSALEERIRDDHECIYCFKVRADVFAVQTHMRDKAHCKIPYMSLEEQVVIGEFYDFRGTYSDSDPEDDEMSEDDDEDAGADVDVGEKAARKRSGGAKLGAKRTAKTEDGGDGGGDDDGWETDSSASAADEEAEGAQKKRPSRAHNSHSQAIYYDEYELHLPSGRSVGHRSLNRYYRQNLHSYPTPEEREKLAQLAIEEGGVAVGEEGEEGEAMEVDVAGNGGSRAVSTRPPPRDLRGLVGVTDKQKAGLQKSERKAMKIKAISEDKDKVRFSAKSIGQSFRFLGR